jgi:hypothetical protein
LNFLEIATENLFEKSSSDSKEFQTKGKSFGPQQTQTQKTQCHTGHADSSHWIFTFNRHEFTLFRSQWILFFLIEISQKAQNSPSLVWEAG